MVSAVPVRQAAPWESVPAKDQLFVLITGANSGVGLGIAQRLIDEFLSTRSLSSHLVLIPTTRSAAKSLETIRTLGAYAEHAAQSTPSLRARAGGDASYRWQDTVARIHVLSPSLDLCDLPGVYAFADALCHGLVSNPEGLDGEYLRNVRLPRIDSVVFNAAYGAWSGVNWLGCALMFFRDGLIDMATYPDFKIALPTRLLNEQSQYNYPAKPLLGEVFTACVFGHYILARQLSPLLSRDANSSVAPGRIIWTSSVEAHKKTFRMDDIQCLERPISYESAKRLTDILALSSTLPSVRPISTPYLRLPSAADMSSTASSSGKTTPSTSSTEVDTPVSSSSPSSAKPPKIYLSHPGVIATTLFPCPWFLMWAYRLVLVICRYIGSAWHTVDSYPSASSVTWLVLQEQSALDAAQAQRVKWGSSSNRACESLVKKTEVEGWGWEGRVEDAKLDTTPGIANKAKGRRVQATDVTEEELVEFEEQGLACWREMERMRLQWEDILADDL